MVIGAWGTDPCGVSLLAGLGLHTRATPVHLALESLKTGSSACWCRFNSLAIPSVTIRPSGLPVHLLWLEFSGLQDLQQELRYRTSGRQLINPIDEQPFQFFVAAIQLFSSAADLLHALFESNQ
jgi:hypothetical protein